MRRNCPERQAEQHRRDEKNRAGIGPNPHRQQPAPYPQHCRLPKPDGPLEGEPAPGDQVIARIPLQTRLGCRGERMVRHLEFRGRRMAGQDLDRGAVEVARREIHLAESAAGPKPRIDQAHALKLPRPVEVGDQPHARDDIVDGHIRRALPLVAVLHDVLDRLSLRAEPLL